MADYEITMDEIELKLNSKVVEDLYHSLLWKEEEKMSKQSISILLHWYVKQGIDDWDQGRLKGPEKTSRDSGGGQVDQVVLLANLLGAGDISYRILKVSNGHEEWHTLEVLVENESENQTVGVDAEKDYRFRQSSDHKEMYWRPCDPTHCRRAGRIDGLEEKDLIEKKKDGDRKHYEWKKISAHILN